MSQTDIYLAIAVNVRRIAEGATDTVEIED
jgi:hypothetical protein